MGNPRPFERRSTVNIKFIMSVSTLLTLIVVMGGTATPNAAATGEDSLAKVLAGLQRHYRETKSFSAKFDEEIAPVGAPRRSRTGTVYFLKPGRMRWNFDEPSKELVVSDGTQVYNYDPELNQVIEAPLAQALRSPGATEFLLGIGDIKKDFNASLLSGSDSALVNVKLVPKGQGNTVELGLDPKNYNVVTIRVIDQLGNATALKFSDIVNNAVVSDQIFQFTPPAGADVVRPQPIK